MKAILIRCLLVILLCPWLRDPARAACVDSVAYHIEPPPCYGGRGTLYIDSVYVSNYALFSVDSISFSTRRVIENLFPGQYRLYILNKDGDPCVYTMDFTMPDAEPLVVTLWASENTIVSGSYVDLHAEIAPAGTVLRDLEWRPPYYFTDPDTLVQRVRLSETETFHVVLHNEAGCPAQAQITIQVEETPVYVPNAFSPYSLANDAFTVFADAGVETVRSLRVYSRTGSMVFERLDFAPNDPSLGWNGRSGAGTVMPGVYIWASEVEYWNGRRRWIFGDVTVLH